MRGQLARNMFLGGVVRGFLRWVMSVSVVSLRDHGSWFQTVMEI